MDDLTQGMVVTGLLLAVGHWAPWPRKLHRLLAYSYGCASILAGQALWLLPAHADAWWGLVGFAVAGGAATAGCYGIDWALNARLQLHVHRGHDERPE